MKDKHGEIIITKLEAYVEPHRGIREVRTDMKTKNNYDFGNLSVDEDDEDEKEEIQEKQEEDEEDVEEIGKSKKKNKKQEKKEENLDDLLAEFGSKIYFFKIIFS